MLVFPATSGSYQLITQMEWHCRGSPHQVVITIVITIAIMIVIMIVIIKIITKSIKISLFLSPGLPLPNARLLSSNMHKVDGKST